MRAPPEAHARYACDERSLLAFAHCNREELPHDDGVTRDYALSLLKTQMYSGQDDQNTDAALTSDAPFRCWPCSTTCCPG